MMPRNTRVLSNQFRRSRPFRRRGRRLSLAPRSLSALLILALLIPALLAGCAGVTETADAPAATAAPEVTAAPSPSPEAADSAPEESAVTDEVNSGPGPWNDRYAVALYGIRQDEILTADGEATSTATAGLTFGPATDRCFNDSYRAHVTEEEYLEDPEENLCLHWMSWEEIAGQSLRDPTAFQACLEYGCTHGVDLRLNERLLARDWSGKITGDGAGALLEGLKRGFLSWNGGYAHADGWPACRARAVLNGADERANEKEVGADFMLPPEESLFSCFPEALRQRIAPKAVVTNLNHENGEPDCVTTYDKLWLFSKSELYSTRNPTEGELYQRSQLMFSKQAAFRGSYVMYSESGSEAYAWLRSIAPLTEVLNRHIFGGGHRTGSGFYNAFALTPGFCLP